MVGVGRPSVSAPFTVGLGVRIPFAPAASLRTIGPTLGRLCSPDAWRRADNPCIVHGPPKLRWGAPFLGGRRLSSLHSCYPTCADRSRAPVPSSDQVECRMPNDAPAACAALFEELADIVFGHPIDAGVDDCGAGLPRPCRPVSDPCRHSPERLQVALSLSPARPMHSISTPGLDIRPSWFGSCS